MTSSFPHLCGSVAGKKSELGVAIHDTGYGVLDIPYKYVSFETDDLGSTIAAMKSLDFHGIGISMPFKQKVIDLLDSVSEDVNKIGACNTIVNQNGLLQGYNTDWKGAVDALASNEILTKGRAVIIGAGGVANAIAYGLVSNGWEVHCSARKEKEAQLLVDKHQLTSCIPFGKKSDLDVDLIVNATPDASYPGGAIDFDLFNSVKSLLDVVFLPVETELCSEALKRGVNVVPGWDMLLHQALYQFELYTGKIPPKEQMKAELVRRLEAF